MAASFKRPQIHEYKNLHKLSLVTILLTSQPTPNPQHPQRRNVVAGHGLAGGAVADVAEFREG